MQTAVNKLFIRGFLSAFFVFSALLFLSGSKKAHAANFTEASLRAARMATSVLDVQILVVAKPATTATEASMQVVFAAGYAVDSTASNITVSTSGLPSTYLGETLNSWPGIGSAASAVSGQTVTVASSDLTPGTLYGFFITAGIDNPSSANAYENTVRTRTSAPATIDESSVTTRIITSDAVTVTGSVPQTFTFTLGANSTTFTTDLSTSSVVSTTGVTVSVATNAQGGYGVFVRSANAALNSATTGESIGTSGSIDGSPTTLSPGSNGYVLDADETTDSGTGDGNLTISGEYNGASTTAGGTLSSTLQEVATCDGTTDGDVVTLIARATINAVLAAADDYTDTLTVVGAGNF